MTGRRFRQRMAWLHAWCGVVCGGLLCAIFLTGTLSVFRDPITRWMQAEPLPAARDETQATEAAATETNSESVAKAGIVEPATETAIARSLRHLADVAPSAPFWRIELPSPGQPLRIAWRDAERHEHQALIDPATGEPVPAPRTRSTEGGRHFMSFHYSLHGGLAGFWIVGIAAAGMLVALVSGVIVHKRLFQDFFTFRPGKGQRSWLDAHNATGVLALPFLLMITYTGLAFFDTSYVPLPLGWAYGGDAEAHRRYRSALALPAFPASASPSSVSPATALPSSASSSSASAPGAARATIRRPSGGDALQPLDVLPLLRHAQAVFGEPAARIVVERPGGDKPRVVVIGRPVDSARTRRVLNATARMTFDGTTGGVLSVDPPGAEPPDVPATVHRVIETLHVASFGGWAIKWLYFVGGLAGTIMLATGTVLFVVKRGGRGAPSIRGGAMASGAMANRVMTGGETLAPGHRLVQIVNVGTIAGIAIASIAYFYANRLLPLDLADRAGWEIRVFFVAWLTSFAHAAVVPAARAWPAQWTCGAVLCLGLPVLNALTTGQHLGRYALAGDWQRAAVEIVSIAIGMLFALIAHRAARASSVVVEGPGVEVGVGAVRTPRAGRHDVRVAGAGARTSARQRWPVVARVLAATAGAYGSASALSAVLALSLPPATGLSLAASTQIATLLSFPLYVGLVIRVFGTQRTAMAWAGLLWPSAAAGVALLALR